MSGLMLQSAADSPSAVPCDDDDSPDYTYSAVSYQADYNGRTDVPAAYALHPPHP